MKHTKSIKKNHEFKRLYNKGDNQASPFLAMYLRKNGTASNQLGITVGVKLGNAVTRNKVRRRIKEIYRTREDSLKKGYHIVIVARNRCASSTYAQIEKSFLLLCDQLDLSIHPTHPVKFNQGGSGGGNQGSNRGSNQGGSRGGKQGTHRSATSFPHGNQTGTTGKQKVNNRQNNTSSNGAKTTNNPS